MYFNLDFSFHHLTRHSHKDVDISEVVAGIIYYLLKENQKCIMNGHNLYSIAVNVLLSQVIPSVIRQTETCH